MHSSSAVDRQNGSHGGNWCLFLDLLKLDLLGNEVAQMPDSIHEPLGVEEGRHRLGVLRILMVTHFENFAFYWITWHEPTDINRLIVLVVIRRAVMLQELLPILGVLAEHKDGDIPRHRWQTGRTGETEWLNEKKATCPWLKTTRPRVRGNVVVSKKRL